MRLEFLFPPFPPLLSAVYQGHRCLSSLGLGRGAHGWVVMFCQPWVQSLSWSWLPIVEVLDVSGTQPQLSNAVVTNYYTIYKIFR